MFFVLTRYKTVLKPMVSGTVPQRNLESCLLGCSPPFGSNKTFFYSNYCLLIISPPTHTHTGNCKEIKGKGLHLLHLVCVSGLGLPPHRQQP